MNCTKCAQLLFFYLISTKNTIMKTTIKHTKSIIAFEDKATKNLATVKGENNGFKGKQDSGQEVRIYACN